MGEVWTRRVLYFAGLWNILGGMSALVDPNRHLGQMYSGSLSLSNPLQAFFFRGVWINVVAWGIGYVLAGRLPATRTGVLAAGGLGKIAYFGACLALFMSGQGSAILLAAGILDIAFAAFFAYVIWCRAAGETAVT